MTQNIYQIVDNISENNILVFDFHRLTNNIRLTKEYDTCDKDGFKDTITFCIT